MGCRAGLLTRVGAFAMSMFSVLRVSILALSALAGSYASAADPLSHELSPNLGQAAPTNFESVVMPDGEGLPKGRGSVAEGRQLYAQSCAACHGVDGEQSGNELTGGIGSLATNQPVKTVGSFWPYATTLYDYIKRAMPYGQEKSLSDNEVYAVTAYVLYLNGIIDSEANLDEANLADIEMPNASGFIPASSYQPL